MTDKEKIKRLRKGLKLLRNADNWGRYAGITVTIDQKSVTTVGNIIAEALSTIQENS